ncbi:MAG: hypothetical protein ACYC1Q_09950, partial [Bacteroidia bacterium]
MANRLLFTVIGLLFAVSQSFSTHVISGEIYWRHLGNRVFDVYVVYYNDCAGVDPTPVNLNIKGSAGSFYRSPVVKTTDQIDYAPSSCIANPCVAQAYKRLNRNETRYRVDLSSDTSCSYSLYLDDCCRMGYSTNTPGDGIRVIATMNLCAVDSQYWNSPNFIARVHPTASAGGIHQLSFLADDTIQGFDSVSYQLVQPANGSNPLTYYTGFSYDLPLTYFGYPINNTLVYGRGFALDPKNGQLVFRPMLANESTSMAVSVKSYRKKGGVWQMASETTRDMFFHTQNATINRFPYFPAPLSDIRICDSTDTYMDVIVADSNTTDSLSLTIYGKTPAYAISSLSTNGINRTFRIRFFLDSLDWRSEPYHLVLEVRDNRCTGTAMGVSQLGLSLYASIDTTLFMATFIEKQRICNRVEYRALQIPTSSVYGWYRNGNPLSGAGISIEPDTAEFVMNFEASKSACHFSYVDTLILDSLYHFQGQVNGLPEHTCEEQELEFEWQVSGGLGWEKYTLNGRVSDSGNYKIPASDTLYLLQARDSSGCTVDTAIRIGLYPALKSASSMVTDICRENIQPFYFSSLPIGGLAPYSTTWNNQQIGDSLLIPSDTLQKIPFVIVDSIGCRLHDTLILQVRPKPVYFLHGAGQICYLDTFKLEIQHFFDTSLVRFNWGMGYGKSPQVSIHPFADTTLYIQIRDSGNCTLLDTFELRYFESRPPVLDDSLFYCEDQTYPVSYSFNSLIDSIVWNDGSQNFYQNSIVLPTRAAGEFELTLFIMDEVGCAYQTRSQVKIGKVPENDWIMNDLRWCENDPGFNLYDSVLQSGGVWTVNGQKDSLLAASDLGAGDHYLAYRIDSSGCSKIQGRTVRIRESPAIQFSVENSQG